MNNEPVAYINKDDGLVCAKCYKPFTKELTDEEILSLTGFKENPYDIFIEYEKEDLIEFARAILRKAQEK